MIPPFTETPPACPYCGSMCTAVTCACRGCMDLVFTCTCERAVEDTFAREGLCDGCTDAGCLETLADFARCRRVKA